ncbi:hypothetical protein [Companilactobacillus ginsenosidimutans]|uniref:Uncharacterized protein n=1 Tax=Companilactobacillus ginsenosidimutans TaxID=1007676 RepID=A0A0H4R123_9LACO|nr:hypothetical protein [Companilactobacillus ginsenosidimutans]AKP67405.1 hypothetical protein ABM34_07560 [Companilactobacillus ginsenosidimutans]
MEVDDDKVLDLDTERGYNLMSQFYSHVLDETGELTFSKREDEYLETILNKRKQNEASEAMYKTKIMNLIQKHFDYQCVVQVFDSHQPGNLELLGIQKKHKQICVIDQDIIDFETLEMLGFDYDRQ